MFHTQNLKYLKQKEKKFFCLLLQDKYNIFSFLFWLNFTSALPNSFFTLRHTQTSFSRLAGTFLLWEDFFVVDIHYKHFIHSCVHNTLLYLNIRIFIAFIFIYSVTFFYHAYFMINQSRNIVDPKYWSRPHIYLSIVSHWLTLPV